MYLKTTLCTTALAMLLATHAVAQNRDTQIAELRALLQSMEKRLGELQQMPQRIDQRVTEIGGPSPTRVVEPQEKLVVRLYDLSDLFAVAPPYRAELSSDLTSTTRRIFPTADAQAVGTGLGGFGGGFGGSMGGGGMGGGFGGGMGGGGFGSGGFFNLEQSKPKTLEGAPRTLSQFDSGDDTVALGNLGGARTSVENLIEAITATIAQDEWEQVGGDSSIARMGSSLIISARPTTHEQIEALLQLFRKRWGTLRTISLRAYWLFLTDEQVSALVSDAPREDQPISDHAYGVVDDAKWKRVLQTLGAEGYGYRAKLTCYNGQTVSTVAGTQRLFVTGMTPVVGGDQPAYQPIVSLVQQGAALEVTPMTTANGKYVVLDVHSRVNRLGEVEGPARAVGIGAETAAAIDRPQLISHRLATTLRVPVNRTTLVGGMSWQDDAGPESPELYLFVRVTVQELRDEPKDENPEVEGSQ